MSEEILFGSWRAESFKQTADSVIDANMDAGALRLYLSLSCRRRQRTSAPAACINACLPTVGRRRRRRRRRQI